MHIDLELCLVLNKTFYHHIQLESVEGQTSDFYH